LFVSFSFFHSWTHHYSFLLHHNNNLKCDVTHLRTLTHREGLGQTIVRGVSDNGLARHTTFNKSHPPPHDGILGCQPLVFFFLSVFAWIRPRLALA
jgi:hypothetical protein